MSEGQLVRVHSTLSEWVQRSNTNVAKAELAEAVAEFKSRWALENNVDVNQAIEQAEPLSLTDVEFNGAFDRKLRSMSDYESGSY